MALNNQATTEIQATTAEINNLIAIVQTAPSAKAYERAIHALWAIFGDFFTALVAKKSYLLDSDFSLWGCSPAERRENLAGNVSDQTIQSYTDKVAKELGGTIKVVDFIRYALGE